MTSVRYAPMHRYLRDGLIGEVDTRTCVHRGYPVTCDCDTIAMEKNMQDSEELPSLNDPHYEAKMNAMEGAAPDLPLSMQPGFNPEQPGRDCETRRLAALEAEGVYDVYEEELPNWERELLAEGKPDPEFTCYWCKRKFQGQPKATVVLGATWTYLNYCAGCVSGDVWIDTECGCVRSVSSDDLRCPNCHPEPAFDPVEALAEVITDLRGRHKDARASLPRYRLDDLGTGKLLGKKEAYAYAITQLEQLRLRIASEAT